MQLSKLDNKVYNQLKYNKIFVFRVEDICRILNIKKGDAYNIIKSLKRKKAIKKAGKSYYSYVDTNEYVIATSINYPSYISFWTALNYYGFTDNNPKSIFVATTKQSKETNNFKYVTLSKKRFYGYLMIGELVIAEKEKAIIDSLLFPRYSGGIKEVIKCIKNSIKELDVSKLIKYGKLIESKSVLRRVGYILDDIGVRDKELKKINKEIGKGYELLDPNLIRKNNFNKKWLLDINI